MVAIGPVEKTIKTCEGCPALKITKTEKNFTNYFGEEQKTTVANIKCTLGKSKPQNFRGLIFLPANGCPLENGVKMDYDAKQLAQLTDDYLKNQKPVEPN